MRWPEQGRQPGWGPEGDRSTEALLRNRCVLNVFPIVRVQWG